MKSCNNVEDVFIEKYGKCSFDEFQYYKIFRVRSNDAPIFFIEEINNPMQIRYVIEMNANKTGIKILRKEFIMKTAMTDNVIVNKKQL